jgi:hypothetical protein
MGQRGSTRAVLLYHDSTIRVKRDRLVFLYLRQAMLGRDSPDRPGSRSHYDRVRLGTVPREANSFHQIPGRDPGHGEEDVVRAHKVVSRENLVEFEPEFACALAFFFVTRIQRALNRPADALERCRRHDRFR